MKRRSGYIWIVAGIALALIAGLLAVWVILRAAPGAEMPVPQEPEVEVVVASRFIAVRQSIQPNDIEVKTAPADIVPENAARSAEEVVGYLALTALSPGQMILTSQVVSPTVTGRHISFLMDETQVAMAFPPNDLMSSINLLQPGDHVDILFSVEIQGDGEGSTDFVTFDALQNLEIATIVYPRDLQEQAGVEAAVSAVRPKAIVFALDPQDALVLKHLLDIGGMVDIVLRAPQVEEQFSTQPVNEDYLIDRYQLRIPLLP